MKNFKLLWTKRVKTEFGKAVIRCYKHLETNNLIYSHSEIWKWQGKDMYWHSWTDRIGEKNRAVSSGSLKYWIDYFYKHPITLGK